MNNQHPRADYMLARLFATLLFGALLFVVGYGMGEHRGYDMARAECRAAP